MAHIMKDVYTGRNLHGNEVVGAVVGDWPATGAVPEDYQDLGGAVKYDSGDMYFNDGTAWRSVVSSADVGVAGGVAELDEHGMVPSSQLPSYVDDTVEGYLHENHFYTDNTYTTPVDNDQEDGFIFIDLESNLCYRWGGSVYVEISPSLALGETSSTAYRGDRGKTAYDHATDANRVTTAVTSGAYKFGVTAEGHIANTSALDLKSLGDGVGYQTNASQSATITATTNAGFAFSDGCYFALRMLFDNLANSTLNVRDTGAKDIVMYPVDRTNNYGLIRVPEGYIKAGDVALFLGHNDQWRLVNIKRFSDNFPVSHSYRTPSSAEWTYLLNTRSASTVSGTSNARYAKVQVNGINGLIILPDVFTLPTGITMNNVNDGTTAFTGNQYTIADWQVLEDAGCVFLPATGSRDNATISGTGIGYYYASTAYSTDNVFYLTMYGSDVSVKYNMGRHYGIAVRCIDEAKTGFTIAAGVSVGIAKGNLQYRATTDEWRIAPHAYDVIGADNANISSTYNGWIDLFGWGTSGAVTGATANLPTSTSTTNEDYYPLNSATQDLTGAAANADWGVYNNERISDADANEADLDVRLDNAESNITALQTTTAQHTNQITDLQNDDVLHDPRYNWRTPRSAEWDYLLNTRSASTVSGVSNARYTKAQVNDINGLIILPDTFTLPTGITMTNINTPSTAFTGNVYTLIDWQALESAGCVFLPAGGYRTGATPENINVYGRYWSVSYYNLNNAYNVTFHGTNCTVTNNNIRTGLSIRCISNNSVGAFSVSATTKCDFAKGNLQYHCKNNKWRFARNQYDTIGANNQYVAQNYDGWIDLFGWGTSGWKSQAVCYQPWSTSSNNSDYRPDGTGTHDLMGNYALADWGVFASKGETAATPYKTYNDNTSDIVFADTASYQTVNVTGSTQTFNISIPQNNTFVNYILVKNTGTSSCVVTLAAATGMPWTTFVSPESGIEVAAGKYVELSFISIENTKLIITASAPLV